MNSFQNSSYTHLDIYNLKPLWMSFANAHRLQSISVPRKSDLVTAMKSLDQTYTSHISKLQLAYSTVDLFNKHCEYFMSIASGLHLQCPSNCSWYVYLNAIFEVYYSPYLFLLLCSPPTNLAHVVHSLPSQLNCTDSLSGVITFPYQILNSHEIIHSLKNPHNSHWPEIPVKFPDLSECIITIFH